MELDYLDWVPVKELAKRYKVAQKLIRTHMDKGGLRDIRINETKTVCERVIERGMNQDEPPSWTEVLSAVKHVDTLSGKLIDKKAILVGITREERVKEMEDEVKQLDKGILAIIDGDDG